MKARLGTVLSNNVQVSRGLPQGAPESPVIFTLIMELVLRDLVKSWKVRNMAWSLDDFVLAAICCADDVVLVAASVAAAEVMVAEVMAKLKEVGLTVGAEKTHLTSHPKMMETSIEVDGLAVLWEEVLNFRGRRCDWAEMQDARSHTDLLKRTSVWRSGDQFEFFMAPKEVAPEHCENCNVAGFSLELERMDDGKSTKRQNCELECENGGERDWNEEATVDGNGPVVETLALDWLPLDREVQHERSDCYQRASAQLGRSCCQNGQLGDLREDLELSGLQWWRWRQIH